MSDFTFTKCDKCGEESARMPVRAHAIKARCAEHTNTACFYDTCPACRVAAGLPSYVDEEIVRLRATADRMLAEATRLSGLIQLYPELRRHEGRWKKVAWCSRAANAKVDRFDVRHNCGCCSDSPLEIWPRVEADNVYSDPPCFRVGEKDGYGDRPYENWDAEMRAAGIPDAIVGAVSMIFDRRREAMRARAAELASAANADRDFVPARDEF